MANSIAKNIVLPRFAIQEKQGIVVLPLKKWKRIEQALEDLEMYQSAVLAIEIAKRRKQKTTVSLEKLLKKYRI